MSKNNELNDLIVKSGLKRSHIAKEIGLTPYGLAMKINGVTEFKASEIRAMCKILNIVDLKKKEKIFFG